MTDRTTIYSGSVRLSASRDVGEGWDSNDYKKKKLEYS
jgi:hypothetical protein